MRESSLSESRIALTTGSLNGTSSAFSVSTNRLGSSRSFVGRSSVTNMYISSGDTGLTPTFTLSPIQNRVRTISGGRGMTARQTHWPM